MPSLSHKRLHGREAMLRALLRAGQFAHVHEADLSEQLDWLYDIEYRLRIGPDHVGHALAVPMALVKARETGLFSERHYDAQTIDFLALMEGVVCCLCLRVDKPIGPAGVYGIPKGFVMYVCPTFLRAEGRPRFDEQPPLCLPCRQGIANRLYREHGIFNVPPDNPHLWASILAWLPTSKAFRDRVKENAKNVSHLRFDPRHIPTPQRLRAELGVCT